MFRKTAIATALAATSIFGIQAMGQQSPGKSQMTAVQPDQPNNERYIKASGEQAQLSIERQLKDFSADPKTVCDKVFVLMASCDNMKEIQAGEVVEKSAQNQKVKDLAHMLIEDHRQAQQKLEPVAKALGVELPGSLTTIDQEKLFILTTLPAEQMEKEFVTDQEADHARDILKFEAIAQSSQNEQVKQFAQETLPKLQHHEDMAMQAAKDIGVPCSLKAMTAGVEMDR